jgi:hypothetical protein
MESTPSNQQTVVLREPGELYQNTRVLKNDRVTNAQSRNLAVSIRPMNIKSKS